MGKIWSLFNSAGAVCVCVRNRVCVCDGEPRELLFGVMVKRSWALETGTV